MIGRREFITMVGGVAVARPIAARAQQPAMPVVGFLVASSPGSLRQQVAAFREGLKEFGLCRRPERGNRISLCGGST